jgi:hypothetical protein
MPRTKLLILVGTGVLALALTVVAVLVGIPLLRSIGHTPSPSTQLPGEALTPEESDTEVRIRPDGTVTIRQRLIFEVPADGDAPLYWRVDSSNLGRHATEERTRYALLPKVEELTAVELSTAPGSTKISPAEDGHVFRFHPPEESGTRDAWGEGRHVVEFNSVLSGVHLDVAGHDLIVLPLQLVGAPGVGSTATTVRVTGAEALYCLPDNVEVELDSDCDGRRVEVDDDKEDTLRITVGAGSTGNIEAIAVKAPSGLSAPPTRATELRR